MKCSSLNSLPSPPEGKAGWPWTEVSEPMPQKVISRDDWPLISIVTPSYNQGQYIEETIRSVLLQEYPDIEYIIIDGGSTDETIDVIKKYESWLTYWISEPDQGQTDALQKGFAHATGTLLCYINSDDFYEKNAFANVARAFKSLKQPELIVGRCLIFDQAGQSWYFKAGWPKNLSHFLNPFSSTVPQPSTFWKSDVYYHVNGFNQSLHYAFDQEFFLKLGLAGIRPCFINTVISRYRFHESVKSVQTIRFYEETIPILFKYAHQCGLSDRDIKRRYELINDQIAYLKTFETWKTAGRKAAFSIFLKRMVISPRFLMNRKVLGLAFWLMTMKESSFRKLKRL